jgi:hypothetical protein
MKERLQPLSKHSFVRKLLAVLAFVLAVSAVTPRPADAFGYFVTHERWGSAIAEYDGRTAIVYLQKLRFARENPNQNPYPRPRACVALRDDHAGVSIIGCKDNAFTMAASLREAHATGTAKGVVHRLSDGREMGTTALRFDVRWLDMSPPLPKAQASAEGCRRAPWAPEWTTWNAESVANLRSIGHASGAVVADGYGTIPFDVHTLMWWTSLAETTGIGVFDGRADVPLTRSTKPGCTRVASPIVPETYVEPA